MGAVLLIQAGLAAAGVATLAYLAILSLPVSSWLLAAADGYAHYATLPVGLALVSAVVELGERRCPWPAWPIPWRRTGPRTGTWHKIRSHPPRPRGTCRRSDSFFFGTPESMGPPCAFERGNRR